MKYKTVKRFNPQKREEEKWYANAVNAGRFTVKDFAKEIAGRSSLTRGDIENVLNNFLDELPTFLKVGMSIKLGDFGTVRLTLSSEGTALPEEFNASKIKGVKVVFTPSAELKRQLENITFEEAK
jgi:predicted histone-like DNA-binding protein